MEEEMLQKKQNSEEIELLSIEAQEIMGQTPRWIVRWGITIIFLVVLLLITGSFFFNYPDVITSKIEIISDNPSVSIVAKSSGRIENIFAENNSIVRSGEVVAILENSANYFHVVELKEKLGEFQIFFNAPLNSDHIELPNYYSLGEIQIFFSIFQKLFNEFQYIIKAEISHNNILATRNQYNDYMSYISQLKNQVIIQKRTVDLIQKQFYRDSILFMNKIISSSDFEKSELNLLHARNIQQSLLSNIASSKIEMNILAYQSNDLKNNQSEKIQQKIIALIESYDNLKAKIIEWQQIYLIISPIEGKIVFNRYWNINQFVLEGKRVFSVIPTVPNDIIGRANLPVHGSGKVTPGQRVLVRLENYPYMEYGVLEGKLESLSQVPESDQQGVYYTAIISFPPNLITNYNILIPFQNELRGVAEIITHDLSLFERLISPIKYATNKSK